MANVKTPMRRSNMVKLNPKVAAKLRLIADERGTNVNALTNKIMKGFCTIQRKKAEQQSLLSNSNTMPQGVQQ